MVTGNVLITPFPSLQQHRDLKTCTSTCSTSKFHFPTNRSKPEVKVKNDNNNTTNKQ